MDFMWGISVETGEGKSFNIVIGKESDTEI